MILQLVLAFGGSLRHRSSTSILQVSLWLSYISADAVAVYALGTMARESIISGLFGIWAPLLLLHLGGPDTVTAYSTVDNELWERHLLNMVYQVSVAIYVIYLSELKSDLFVAAILLLFVGGFKYAERTVALKWASFSQILKSVHQHTTPEQLPPQNYVVMVLNGREITIDNVREQKTGNGEATEPFTEVTRRPDNYILCLAHALFKMNMRRYVGMAVSGDTREVREFFFDEDRCHLSTHEIFEVIEIELKFMYDTLFCKSRSTAFSKWGTIMRIVNISIGSWWGSYLSCAVPGTRERVVRRSQNAKDGVLHCI
ncbi:hypothetical protein KI387_027390 [Taxus chinensis]|uniref:DUF4220 domain-containing protein n=1 Tax=Taxus chinensis TaxID=29808 RepID=A0AA38FY05_TAXCH|nr:hypothetical protein KI387_027390 [Taxus chinensis]